MKSVVLAGALALIAASPAYATLMLSINVGGSTFSCSDGEVSCDLSGGANNLLTVDQTVGGVFVQLTLTDSSSGQLSLSAANISNGLPIPRSVVFVASNTDFAAPVTGIQESGSLTSATNVGGNFQAQFFADAANTQGANPLNTPGTLLFTTSGAITTAPQSFEGNNVSPIALNSPFSMTEGVGINLVAGGAITGFDENMQVTPVPGPVVGAGLPGLIAGVGFLIALARKRKSRFAAI
jgi:hypothetical protein